MTPAGASAKGCALRKALSPVHQVPAGEENRLIGRAVLVYYGPCAEADAPQLVAYLVAGPDLNFGVAPVGALREVEGVLYAYRR